MEIFIRRITAERIEDDPEHPPYGLWTELEEEEFNQQQVEQYILEKIRSRLKALTIGAASTLEIKMKLSDK